MSQLIVLNCKKLAPNGSIAGVGGLNKSTNAQIHYTEAEAIAAIDAGSIRFEVHDDAGHIADVRVSHHGQHRFLETHRDGVTTDNLAKLPICHHVPVHPSPVPPPYRPVPIHRGHSVFVPRIGERK
jgi:hypothetical protein